MKKIISWNVNGIRAVEKKGFCEWVNNESPDILCIQETKAHPDQLPDTLLRLEPYQSYWASSEKKGYSGVATYSKAPPLEIRTLKLEEFDREGRSQILIFNEFAVINTYFPNSQKLGKRIDYKIAFCRALLECSDALVKEGHPVIICGDFNIAHKEIDLRYPKANQGNAGFLPQEREWMESFLNRGYVDTFRNFNQDPFQYTWWSYMYKAREKNIGWRIDYHCVNEGFIDRIESCEILSHVQGSDHCPVKLTIKN